MQLTREIIDPIIANALEEDLGQGHVGWLPADVRGNGNGLSIVVGGKDRM